MFENEARIQNDLRNQRILNIEKITVSGVQKLVKENGLWTKPNGKTKRVTYMVLEYA
jgi:hypothetical protein